MYIAQNTSGQRNRWHTNMYTPINRMVLSDLILQNSRNGILVAVISLGAHAGRRMLHVSRMGSHVARSCFV